MDKKLLLIAVICLSVGFVGAYAFLSDDAAERNKSSRVSADAKNDIDNDIDGDTDDYADDSIALDDEQRLENLEAELAQLKQQLEQIQIAVSDLAANNVTSTTGSSSLAAGLTRVNRSRYANSFNQRLYNIDNLIKGGVDPGFAEDIVRRKNAVELQRLELQDHATRNGYLNTQRYVDELEEINLSDVSLREELGDQGYDEYLFNSKQNNRVRISSVMLGSPAEQAGIEKGDVVLSYDNNRVFDWQELKGATAQGELGEYVSLSVYRNGEVYSFSVPRGTLGMQLGATRLAP